MFILAVVLFMFVLPLCSGAFELIQHGAPYMIVPVFGKWFVFWGVGVRLFTAGIRQIIRPGLTTEGILKISGSEAHLLVRELGSANVCIGLIAILSLWRKDWLPPSALAGGMFFGFAGLLHCRTKKREFNESLAMYSDLWLAVIALAFFFAGPSR